jgi:NAD(P)-dependent dehydrogenase (short-subunit alcohol dehydrogenase family)
MQFTDHTFLIAGGGSGLGAATARLFAGKGANVVIVDLADRENLVAALGTRVRFAAADVTSEAGVQAAVDLAVHSFGALHGVVNCAGVATPERTLGKAGPQPLANFAKVININLVGTFNVLRLAAEKMQANEPTAEGERGVVINTASVAAFDGQIGQAAYAASKGGVAAMTLPIAREFARMGIRVVTIAPGLFDTPMMASLSPEARASLGQQVPFPPRLGRPEEYAQMAAHIVENVMLNGETIRLDGAIRMAPK